MGGGGVVWVTTLMVVCICDGEGGWLTTVIVVCVCDGGVTTVMIVCICDGVGVRGDNCNGSLYL